MRMQGMKHNVLSTVDPFEAHFEYKFTGRRIIPSFESKQDK